MGIACRFSRRWIHRLFVDRYLGPKTTGRLWKHVQRCEGCRRQYEEAIVLERLVETGGEHALEPARLEIGLFREYAAQRAIQEPRHEGRHGLRLLLAPVGAAAAVLLLVAIVLSTSRQDEHWQARKGAVQTLAVRVFCEVERPSGNHEVLSLSERFGPGEVRSCPPSANVHFAYSSDRAGYLYAFEQKALGARDAMNLVPLIRTLVKVQPTAQLTPVPIHLGPPQLSGHDSITFVFVRSPEPHSVDAVIARLQQGSVASFDIVRRTVAVDPP